MTELEDAWVSESNVTDSGDTCNLSTGLGCLECITYFCVFTIFLSSIREVRDRIIADMLSVIMTLTLLNMVLTQVKAKDGRTGWLHWGC